MWDLLTLEAEEPNYHHARGPKHHFCQNIRPWLVGAFFSFLHAVCGVKGTASHPGCLSKALQPQQVENAQRSARASWQYHRGQSFVVVLTLSQVSGVIPDAQAPSFSSSLCNYFSWSAVITSLNTEMRDRGGKKKDSKLYFCHLNTIFTRPYS